jgi:hypothetical protein
MAMIEVLAEKILQAITSRREDYNDTRENEAHIAGLKQALAIAVGIDEAHRLLNARGDSYW